MKCCTLSGYEDRRRNTTCDRRGVAPVHSGRGPLVEFEFFLPVAVFFQGFLLFFIEHEIFQHESIHFRAHETKVGLFRGTDNGLPANIEGGIDQYRALRHEFEFLRVGVLAILLMGFELALI